MARNNRNRILVAVSAREQRPLESIAIAAASKFEVMSIDVSSALSSKFPAASESIAMVYKELLMDYKPDNIGFYGSSINGLLIAQSIAWFQREGLPAPSAIGLFCMAVAEPLGDSMYYGSLIERRTSGNPISL